ncbi:MAG: transglutaminase family protein, partial [Fibrobacteres bacterium]|nr:transglutaminase family protein [Fibrobacterota bacterium]
MVRTALCLEARNGMLHVFPPPVSRGEDWVELAAIETTAAATGMPVRLEGYPPPWDPRLTSFAITPDPGVIRGERTPSASWDELRPHHHLVRKARSTRLCTESSWSTAASPAPAVETITLGGRTLHRQPVLAPAGRAGEPVRLLDGPSIAYRMSSPGCSWVPPARRHAWTRPVRTPPTSWIWRCDEIPSIAGMPPWMVDRVL